MHVAALAILEGPPLCDPDGRLRLNDLRAAIERRLHLAPRLRRILLRPPLGLGGPLWVDDPEFDVARHVQTRAIEPPGDEPALLAACQVLNERPLGWSRPPWELWFLTGLKDGTVGMLVRLHHAMADGVASVALLRALFNAGPDGPSGSAPPWTPAPAPSTRKLLIDSRRRWSARAARLVSTMRHPVEPLHRLRAGAARLAPYLRDGPAPRTSLNGPLGRRRHLLLARADLRRTKAVAHGHGAKVNDVVLAAVAGGARDLLRTRGELRPDMVLRASVPVSVRRPSDPMTGGNRVGLMVAPLPVGEPDPVRRLEAIARATRERKERPLVGLLESALMDRAMVCLMNRQRLINVFVSNVPGPPTPLFFCGARLVEVFQVGVIQGNVRVGVGVLSYGNQLDIDLVADAESVPDLDVFAEGLDRALRDFGVSVPRSAVGSPAA
jgi:WS/DGAT/MGAT family acyltransferase